MANRTKKQHYIPQLLLRNFRIPGEDLIWVFDKTRSATYKSAIRDVASERYYNDARVGDVMISFESRLERIEALAAPIIAKIVETEDISFMTVENQAELTVFIAAQVIRGKAWRISGRQGYDLLCEKLGGKERAAFAGVPELDEDEEKLSQLLELPKLIEEFAPALVTKDWMLHKTRKDQELFLGDEPVVRQNSTPTDGLVGNLGLACEGIEIYLPLSPHLVLALICPTLKRLFKLSSKHSSSGPAFDADRFLTALDTGKPFLLAPDNVRRLNALQMAHAARFVMSNKDNFAHLREMIRKNPGFGSTPKYFA